MWEKIQKMGHVDGGLTVNFILKSFREFLQKSYFRITCGISSEVLFGFLLGFFFLRLRPGTPLVIFF